MVHFPLLHEQIIKSFLLILVLGQVADNAGFYNFDLSGTLAWD